LCGEGGVEGECELGEQRREVLLMVHEIIFIFRV
jgi:hypothetical protein